MELNQITSGAGTADWENVSKSTQISYVSSVVPSMYAAMPIDVGSNHAMIPVSGTLPNDFMQSVEEYRHLENSLEESDK
jgi:hypothetical protein